ncbi:MAG TPA: cell division protein ZapE [Rhodospirillaceae bacterium]|nr:cell division protein ZapE [Rhodospirillaceae bacterium]HAT34609.1 cell division protein ZapE [Rhodospirillaceae bacterium]
MTTETIEDLDPEIVAKGPLFVYRARRESGELKPDPMQEAAVEKLQSLHDALDNYEPQSGGLDWKARLGLARRNEKTPNGLYIHGPVGRGKSMLMDLFFDGARVKRKRRIHFHEFMIEVHDANHAWRQDSNKKRDRDPLPQIAESIASDAWLICFDEFHVTNIADAMILGRLFESLFDLGVVVVTTSNFEPDLLYKNGLQRERFLPFIDLLKQRLDCFEVASPTDYRLARLKQMKVFHSPLGPASTKALEKSFADLTEGAVSAPETVTVRGRNVDIRRTARGVAWFSFAQLCGEPRGAEDYLTLGRQFHTFILDGVPKLNEETRNEAKRFMTLIDALYELKVNLVMAAETAPHEIYRGPTHDFEFERTISRLMEMQADDYIDAEHLAAPG